MISSYRGKNYELLYGFKISKNQLEDVVMPTQNHNDNSDVYLHSPRFSNQKPDLVLSVLSCWIL